MNRYRLNVEWVNMRETRSDTIKYDNMEMTPQGFLRFPVFAGRDGIQIYMNRDGDIVRELRPTDEVFREETMDSLKHVPCTNEHPEEMVNPENSKELMVGFGSGEVAKVSKDGVNYMKTVVTITDAETIADIQKGKVEVSLGYDVKIEEESGVWNDIPYDSIQRDIMINHLAIVDKGRAGPEVRLRKDRYDAITVELDSDKSYDKNKPEVSMAKMKIGDKEFEVEQDVKDAFSKAMKDMEEKMSDMKKDMDKEKEDMDKEKEDMEKEKDESEKKADSLRKENDKLQAKLDSLTDENEDLKSKTHMDSDSVSKLVRERAALEKVATKVLEKETVEKLDSMKTMEIKKAVIKASTKREVNLDEKSEEYVNARYDAIAENVDTSAISTKKASETFKPTEKKDGDDEAPDWRKNREDNMRKDSERWMQPIGKHSGK